MTKTPPPTTTEDADARLDKAIRKARAAHAKQVAQINDRKNHAPVRRNHARYEQALAMRREGKTFREIGDALKVSRGRAAQLCSMAEWLARRPSRPLEDALSLRAYNIIRIALGITYRQDDPSPDITPEMVAGLSRSSLLAYPNCGAKTVWEIDAWLNSLGYSLRD